MDENQAREAVDSAVRRFGRIDVVVNNGGRGLLGAVEEASDAAAWRKVSLSTDHEDVAHA